MAMSRKEMRELGTGEIPDDKVGKLLRCASFGLAKHQPASAQAARAKVYAKVVKRHLSTRTMPGEEKKDLPGPADYSVRDERNIADAALKGGVEFGGQNIKRELTQVDLSYKAQLDTPGPGSYNIDRSEHKAEWGGVAGMRRVPSMKFATSDRMKEQRALYLGKGTELMAKDTPGPGTYKGTNMSSFKGVNPYGPPHTFGATNHMQNYDSASPGPLAYNVVKPAEYSPMFGFGASQRGAGRSGSGSACSGMCPVCRGRHCGPRRCSIARTALTWLCVCAGVSMCAAQATTTRCSRARTLCRWGA